MLIAQLNQLRPEAIYNKAYKYHWELLVKAF